MHILLKNVKIVAPTSGFHGQQQDILIEDGIIRQIAPAIQADNAKIVTGANLHVSIGWMDIFAHFCDPGQEYKEDLQSGTLAAAKGGFTTVMIVPNTQPALHTKPQITYVLSQTAHSPVQVLPIGAATKNAEGPPCLKCMKCRKPGPSPFQTALSPSSRPASSSKPCNM